MPLQGLIDCFNQRFVEEGNFKEPPLSYREGKVSGRFGASTFTSHLQPVRVQGAALTIAGYDAAVRIAVSNQTPDSLFEEEPNIVALDRLARTVHMLNFLPLSRDEEYLFLHVHPRHILTVQQDHGAYFEEIIVRCGLSPRRVVISLTLSAAHGLQFGLLLERLKNYRARGYATAITFDDRLGNSFLERYYIEFLYRHTPDFVRFDSQFFQKHAHRPSEERRRSSLIGTIQRLDTQLLIDNIQTETDAELAHTLAADFVQGEWYEHSWSPAARAVG